MRLFSLIVPAMALALAALAGAAGSRPGPLPSEVYVWQRHWTPAIGAALVALREHLGAVRVQALAVPSTGPWFAVAVDRETLAGLALPVHAVVRIEGRRSLASLGGIAARIAALVHDWRAAGVDVAGVEIDYDCASARLADYATWLSALRRVLPGDLRLTNTALPAWLDSAALERLATVTDEMILQVHAVDRPPRGLFDAVRARRWVERWAARTAGPFRVSLPAYGSRIVVTRGGALVAVESEAPNAALGSAGTELYAAPGAVAAFVAALDQRRPPGLTGLVWFRLAVAGDRRAWTLATLGLVLARAPLPARFEARFANATDIEIGNVGPADAPLPERIIAAGSCTAGDAVNGYAYHAAGNTGVFLRREPALLRAGARRIIGWLRCAAPAVVALHVEP